MMHKNKSVSSHQFAMVPRAEIPRASFKMERGLKTTFDSSYLVPCFCEEVLPGDTFKVRMTAFARLSTPLFPIMDNLHLDTFFFFVPNRLVWTNWKRFMGEQDAPTDSISFVVPQVVSAAGGFAESSIYDYFGLPTVGQVDPASTVSVNALPLRGYNLIFNEWFRDQNLVAPLTRAVDDGPDTLAWYLLARRGKRHDYFTSCLPWPLKGGTAVSVPLGGTAPVIPSAFPQPTFVFGAGAPHGLFSDATASPTVEWTPDGVVAGDPGAGLAGWSNPGLVADLSAATASTINQIRQAFQIQKLLERDARGGTRYTEIVRAHFGVISPDARLQRPEYLGGGHTPVIVNPIAQTSATDVTGSTTPQGNLSAVGTALASGHGFSQSFTEHGYIIGVMCVRADLTYQQGLRKMWSRSTRYDFYFPAFAMLGEQAVLSKEIFCDGTAGDADVFGYQERWAEYRYSPSQITGLFRSTAALPLDAWHLAQNFAARPTLGNSFIQENVPLQRVLAVGASAAGAEFIMDSVFEMHVARPMPLYSVPGLIDHF